MANPKNELLMATCCVTNKNRKSTATTKKFLVELKDAKTKNWNEILQSLSFVCFIGSIGNMIDLWSKQQNKTSKSVLKKYFFGDMIDYLKELCEFDIFFA